MSPAYRSGAIVDFHARRLSAVTGTLGIRRNGDVRPAEFFQATATVDGRPVTFRTGRGGEFYVEDLKPGRYPARASANGQACTFDLVVPEMKGSIIELPSTLCDAGR